MQQQQLNSYSFLEEEEEERMQSMPSLPVSSSSDIILIVNENSDDNEMIDNDDRKQAKIGWKDWILNGFKGKQVQNNEQQPKLYKMRWVMLMIFTLSMFSSVLAQSTFSSVG